MKIGTKSVLYGYHCFFIHPWFVAWAWWKLYGFPWDPRLWVAFFVHDLGYIGKPNMDGEEGEEHPRLGADIMSVLFDGFLGFLPSKVDSWYFFTLLHSRYLANKIGKDISRLCVADKLSIANTPWWLALPLMRMSGELAECKEGKDGRTPIGDKTEKEWWLAIQAYTHRWLKENHDATA